MAKRGTKPPYTAAADVEAFFGRIRTIAAPKKLDKGWVESFLPTVKQPPAIPTLARWLALIDEADAADSATWNKIRIPDSRPEALAPLVREAYSAVFEGVTVEDASRGDLDAIFVTSYDDTGNPQRYVGCFLTLCKLAGIPTTTSLRESSRQTTNGSGAATAAKPRIESEPKKQTTPKRKNDPPPTHSSPGVMIALNVEIPADWTEAEIRERISVVSRALRETGVDQA